MREIQISYPYVIEPVGDVVVAYAARFSSVKISFFENVLTKYFILIQRRAKKKLCTARLKIQLAGFFQGIWRGHGPYSKDFINKKRGYVCSKIKSDRVIKLGGKTWFSIACWVPTS